MSPLGPAAVSPLRSSTDDFPSDLEELLNQVFNAESHSSNESQSISLLQTNEHFNSNSEQSQAQINFDQLKCKFRIKCFRSAGYRQPYKAIDFAAIIEMSTHLVLTVETDPEYRKILEKINLQVIPFEDKELLKNIAFIVSPIFEIARKPNRCSFKLKVDKNEEYLGKGKAAARNDFSKQKMHLKFNDKILCTMNIRGFSPSVSRNLTPLFSSPSYLELSLNNREAPTFLIDEAADTLNYNYFDESNVSSSNRCDSIASDESHDLIGEKELHLLESTFNSIPINTALIDTESLIEKFIGRGDLNNQLVQELDLLLLKHKEASMGVILGMLFKRDPTMQDRYLIIFLSNRAKIHPHVSAGSNSRTYSEIKTDYDSRPSQCQYSIIVSDSESSCSVPHTNVERLPEKIEATVKKLNICLEKGLIAKNK